MRRKLIIWHFAIMKLNYWSAPFLIQNRLNVWNVDQDILEVV